MATAEVIGIFPTVIYSTVLDNHVTYDRLIMDNMSKHGFESDTLITGEPVGNSLVHCDPAFADFFAHIAYHAEKYAAQLSVKNELFDYFITKSWYVIVNNVTQKVKYHTHSAGHISFVYYANLPPKSDILNFNNHNQPNALFDGLLDTNPDPTRCLINEINELNCKSYSIIPEEGQLMLFPSKLPHGTIWHPDNTEGTITGKRVAIAGDINLILREDVVNFESGKLNPRHWRKF